MSDDIEQRLICRLDEFTARLAAIEAQMKRALPLALDRLNKPAAEYMTIVEASEHFKLSPQYLYKCRGVLVKAGRAVRVDVAKLREHLEAS